MKQLFIGLVVLNVCYLLFQQMSAAEVVAPQERPADSASSVPSYVPSSVLSETLPEPVPSSVSQLTVEPDDAMPGPEQPRIGLKTGSSNTSLVASTVVASSALPAAALLVMKKADQSASVSSVGAAKLAALGVAQPLPGCVIAGPFRAKRDGQALVQQLANAGIDATLQPRDTALLPDYMVYVGPESSQADARALEAVFKARNMDSHLIAAGNLQNALSLGVFSRGPLAKSLHDRLQKEGYAAHISELTRNRRGYQVRTRLPQLIRAKLVESDTPMIDCPQTIAQR